MCTVVDGRRLLCGVGRSTEKVFRHIKEVEEPLPVTRLFTLIPGQVFCPKQNDKEKETFMLLAIIQIVYIRFEK